MDWRKTPQYLEVKSDKNYFDEQYVAIRVKQFISRTIEFDLDRVTTWVEKYCQKHEIALSTEQQESVGIVGKSFSILTGGPGCGKTTTTKVLAKLLQAMNKRVLLAAPTGRAVQRMSEVIGSEAKTIHRLLEVDPSKGGFKKGEEDPLQVDFFRIRQERSAHKFAVDKIFSGGRFQLITPVQFELENSSLWGPGHHL